MCLLKMYVGNASLSAELIEHTLFDSKIGLAWRKQTT